MAEKVSPEVVLKIARLARLSLTETEVIRLSDELSAIIGYFEKLNELDTDGVQPTSHTLDIVNALRADSARESLVISDVTFSAPCVRENLFFVPPIKEEEESA